MVSEEVAAFTECSIVFVCVRKDSENEFVASLQKELDEAALLLSTRKLGKLECREA